MRDEFNNMMKGHRVKSAYLENIYFFPTYSKIQINLDQCGECQAKISSTNILKDSYLGNRVF